LPTVVIPAADPPRQDDQRALGISRLIAGGLQGIVLYLLYLSTDTTSWPSTNPYWMAPLLMVWVFVPLLFLQAVGTMRTRTLAIWTVAATVLLAGLAWYDIWRQWDGSAAAARASLSFGLIFFSAIGLFIAHCLIVAGDIDRQYIAKYATYFEASWKLGAQIALAFAFVAVFWGVLWLGAILFTLIDLTFIETLIEKSWFAIPATTMAVAAAIHLTDVRSRLVGDIRAIVISLLSWLLPLMTIMAIGFVVSLPFTGLTSLWATHSAAAILLAAAATLVVLVNATYQNGAPPHPLPFVLRYSELAAGFVLVPIAALATYALSLRIAQFGLTVERIATAACVVLALGYAIGYATAGVTSLREGAWMQRIEAINIAAAFAVLAMLLFLFSPLGDPARLSVDSQLERLKNGTVPVGEFDYDYLKTDGGRYGREALNGLASGQFGAQSELIHKLAKAALAGFGNLAARQAGVDITRNVTVYPPSRELPRSLTAQDWSRITGAPACLTTPDSKCDAFYADLDGDGTDELILTTGSDASFAGTILQKGADQQWKPVGNINGHCAGMLTALKKGDATVVPSASLWRDWVVMGIHLHPARSGEPPQPCPRRF